MPDDPELTACRQRVEQLEAALSMLIVETVGFVLEAEGAPITKRYIKTAIRIAGRDSMIGRARDALGDGYKEPPCQN